MRTCNLRNCLDFTFLIRNNTLEYHTEGSIVVEYILSGALSQEHLSGSKRSEVAKITESSVSDYLYNQFESPENMNLLSSNQYI